MSKELEYILRQIDIVKQQVKGSKMKIIVTDAVTKHQYDYYENELQNLESIEKSLKALEIIKEKNVSIFQLSCCKNVNEYNDLKFKDSEKLTEEEFSLLKEMLGC